MHVGIFMCTPLYPQQLGQGVNTWSRASEPGSYSQLLDLCGHDGFGYPIESTLLLLLDAFRGELYLANLHVALVGSRDLCPSRSHGGMFICICLSCKDWSVRGLHHSPLLGMHHHEPGFLGKSRWS